MVGRAAFEAYVEDLIAGRRAACREAVQALLEAGEPVRAIFLDLFTASLHEIGRRWELGEVSVAQEHLATAITEELLALVFPVALQAAPAAGPPPRRTALVACAPNELHQIGGRIVADALELAGWDTRFLGADTPDAELVALAARGPFDAVLISVALRENLPAALRTAASVRAAAPGSAVVVGGGALSRTDRGSLQVPAGVQLVADLPTLEATLPSLFP